MEHQTVSKCRANFRPGGSCPSENWRPNQPSGICSQSSTRGGSSPARGVRNRRLPVAQSALNLEKAPAPRYAFEFVLPMVCERHCSRSSPPAERASRRPTRQSSSTAQELSRSCGGAGSTRSTSAMRISDQVTAGGSAPSRGPHRLDRWESLRRPLPIP
jgi:hypothetical protein